MGGRDRARRASGHGVTHIRCGIVLTPEGGALAKQLPIFRIGLGGRFGSGSQWQSWIAMDDEVAGDPPPPDDARVRAGEPHGAEPGAELRAHQTLGRVLHRPAVLPVPKLGPSLLLGGELTESLLYFSQRVLPREARGVRILVHPSLGRGCSPEHAHLT